MVYHGIGREGITVMTVREVSRLTGVSVRALQYYDRIGLLCPAARTEAGYRLYDEKALATLQQILLFHELEFPLRDIREMLHSPDFDRDRALEQQIRLLEMKKERLEKLTALARDIRTTGGKHPMDFSAFDTRKIDAYAVRAREAWGQTPEYREFERKAEGRTPEETDGLNRQMMAIFAAFGAIREEDPASEKALRLTQRLQDFISAHFYACSDAMLGRLGAMYAAGGEMTENIDRAGGEGTAAFAARAIEARCAARRGG